MPAPDPVFADSRAPATACWTPAVPRQRPPPGPEGRRLSLRPPSRSGLREGDSQLGQLCGRHRRPRCLRTGADRTDRAALLRLAKSTIHPPIGVLFRFDPDRLLEGCKHGWEAAVVSVTERGRR
jgi:hypothetical protein